ncbi:hypothetical protein X777_14012 [Ooceraea biroi]|uniref:Uncharacterized protein n=1 Tax=Ooceraea biroi TaxID=2015173 RepID=A0A026WYE0_OOCBI|nr:hypothetical protein X777_14012 [Ooceraea biroi]
MIINVSVIQSIDAHMVLKITRILSSQSFPHDFPYPSHNDSLLESRAYDIHIRKREEDDKEEEEEEIS